MILKIKNITFDDNKMYINNDYFILIKNGSLDVTMSNRNNNIIPLYHINIGDIIFVEVNNKQILKINKENKYNILSESEEDFPDI